MIKLLRRWYKRISELIDKTILDLLTILVAGGGLIAALIRFNPPQLYMMYWGANPFAEKKEVIENCRTWFFLVFASIGLLIQLWPLLGYREIPAHRYSTKIYRIFFMVALIVLLILIFILNEVSKGIAHTIWFPQMVRAKTEHYNSILKKIDENNLYSDIGEILKDSIKGYLTAIPTPTATPIDSKGLGEVSQDISEIERLLDVEPKSKDIGDRIDKLRQLFLRYNANQSSPIKSSTNKEEMTKMTLNDILVIFALFAGPTIAVQVQKIIENYKETRNRKLMIFKTLMATRGTPLAPMHVEGLNRIDLEFSNDAPDEKSIIDAWKVYLDNLNTGPGNQNDSDFKLKLEAWAEKNRDLLASLLSKMAKSLGYDFDEVHLKKGMYLPKGHADIELELDMIRKGLVSVFNDQKSIPIHISQPHLEENIKKEYRPPKAAQEDA